MNYHQISSNTHLISSADDTTRHDYDNDADETNYGEISVIQAADDESLRDQIMYETCRELEISADKEVNRLEITVFKQEVP